ncbi:hypothetical protein CDL15_Pgr026402 [Punica granatum]|uniref:Uncharacterized protein n=1 Tax=Punica granatum TaxID=22663 RepID=A0A218XNW9_PUNGR|nr:hypothetical protein CDL15_Pgr026402 [Punica granatum]
MATRMQRTKGEPATIALRELEEKHEPQLQLKKRTQEGWTAAVKSHRALRKATKQLKVVQEGAMEAEEGQGGDGKQEREAAEDDDVEGCGEDMEGCGNREDEDGGDGIGQRVGGRGGNMVEVKGRGGSQW